MKQTQFEKFIRGTRDCDSALLDIAVKRGLHRARSDERQSPARYEFDITKLIRLGAMCAATALLCAVLHAEPVKSAVSQMTLSNATMPEGNAQMLLWHYTDFVNTIINISGGN